ncbi:MAG: hypothetical protein Q8862_06675, partial [Bacteroidota bacterium]|nr:hypothetical protein [Bacteroidota bacterium]
DRLNMVFLYNEKELKVIKTDVFRSAGLARIAIPVPDLTQQEGYVFWSSFDDKRFSPSVYWKG